MPTLPPPATKLIDLATRPALADVLWSEGAETPGSDSMPTDTLAQWEVAAVLADADGKVVYTNPASEALTGYQPIDLAYRAPWTTWRWHHEADQSLMPFETSKEGLVWRGQAAFSDADGCAISAHCAVYPLGNRQGHTIGMLITLRDYSETLRQARLDAMNTISGRVAHDLNNLLTIQVAYAQMLVEEMEAGSQGREEAVQVLHSVRRVMDLAHKLMLSSGRVTPGSSVIDLGELVVAMDEDLAETVPDGVETAVAVAPREMHVRAHAEDVSAMLNALMQNALEAVGLRGSVSVAVRPLTLVEPEGMLAPGEYILVAVTDSGPGVSAEQREHLYEPLFAHKRGGVGTGLGLAMARGVAIAHGGLLRLVENPSGEGARFEVLLPAVD